MLKQEGDERYKDAEFVNGRAEIAAAEYENRRKEGLDVFSALEYAKNTLTEGVVKQDNNI